MFIGVICCDLEKVYDYVKCYNVVKVYILLSELINDNSVDVVYIVMLLDSYKVFVFEVVVVGKFCCIEKLFVLSY